jgi:hypothetical protein
MRIALACLLALGLVSVPAYAPAYAVVPTEDEPTAILRALDKVTARVEELDIPEGQPFKFGALIITVRACRVTSPEETPEAAAFLEISEFKPGENDTPVFRGWMFASSPALSAMEHPVYDIWVIGCKGTPTPVPAEPNAQTPAPAPASAVQAPATAPAASGTPAPVTQPPQPSSQPQPQSPAAR